MNHQHIDGLEVYDIPDNVCLRLLEKVEETRQFSYPKPNKIASVVLTADGAMFDGVSYHTEIMSLTMHAEATALAHAAIHGHQDIVAITGPNCHACKQLICEHSVHTGIDIVVVMRQANKIITAPISSMMMYAWPERPKD